MKKYVLIICLAISLLLSACGKEKALEMPKATEQTTPQPSTDSSDSKKITKEELAKLEKEHNQKNQENTEAKAVEKIIDDSAKNNKLTQVEMLKIGKEKLNHLTTIYTISTEDELNKYLSDTYIDKKRYEPAAREVFSPTKPSEKVENTFENESVELLGETGMKYNATITTKITEKNGEVNQYKNHIQIQFNKDKNDNQYKIISLDTKQ